ncbi:50S ribosomal protein L23 [candidate division WOR-1 bacterium RIFOXYD2_FULL_36_8]|uniref:Large ribosomal subunit protein uL23 n=1 Tax=candidate division WOR-1 bacterium RIFOXYB2_FULL_36_35 TaxID=1802578 RepID=A0A1F4S547_UNCSA|nr:MAG: 50S ribosomal protein L23 [candidate division WOR-1 bacterium RIFOXYA2_FULL_36_21]OGC15530.1 MAG: 50S ribosomal protein L23 [candidate division WOR-1 bacterium RIFOXYB2_FULL_36_35]OGC21315.1 MAG: 50S ribosomal protein L23 [candidate division WOR-1 bacterium RIFOXYA12_FULL_36_13]OGC38388.1 MAG: 50S ribosomal protein L23 [candidate division WOR-1 bacterium RIFOXYD2_FULL_36_8]
MNPHQIILEPIITEKALNARTNNVYVFKIHPKATKVDVKSAISKLFRVLPLSVKTVKIGGKRRIVGSKVGRTASYKKAYVLLPEGKKIEELEVA